MRSIKQTLLRFLISLAILAAGIATASPWLAGLAAAFAAGSPRAPSPPAATTAENQRENRGDPAPPVTEGLWVRPAATAPAQPVWGHAKGLRVGLWPLPGPRGLLRVYAPYLSHPPLRMINYLAVEPIVGHDRRGFSELEVSRADNAPGKGMWSSDDPNPPAPARPARQGDAVARPDQPARGQIIRDGHLELLRVYIQVEKFDNGAAVCLRLTFRSDRPEEVGVATFAAEGSANMESCVITATMGNYARLRQLRLAGKTVTAKQLWATFDSIGFATRASFPLSEVVRNEHGDALAAATNDEADPAHAEYTPQTPPSWRYQGLKATQYWRCEKPDARLTVQVNGRCTYWSTREAVPGGVAFENFEMVQPFRQGQEVWFGVAQREPQDLPR